MTARTVAGLCSMAAGIVIAGWVLGLPQFTTFGRAWTPMVVSTSLLVLLGAMAILAIAAPRPVPDWRIVGWLGAVIAAIAGVTFANFSSYWLRDVYLYPQVPAWRMAPHTAIAFLSVGVALALMGRAPRKNAVAEGLLGFALLVAVVMLVAFLFGAAPRSDLMGRVIMSPITGVCLAVLTVTLLCLVPDGLFASVVSGSGPGSRIARPLFALAVITPVTLGWFRLNAEKLGWLSLEYGVALMVIGTTMVSTFTIFLYSVRVNRYDARLRRELGLRQEAEDKHRRAHEHYRTLFKASPLPMWMFDVNTLAFLAVNDAAVRHYGYSADEFLRLTLPDIRTPEDAERMHSQIAQQTGGATLTHPARHRKKDGARIDVEVTWSSISIEGRDVLLSVVNDVTERKRAEAALQALTTELEERVAQRTAELAVTNRELESFSYSVSHDLRTPLRALDGFSQALLEDYGDRLDAAGKDYLDRIRRGSQRMGDLIDSLLDLSRVSRGQVQREIVDLSVVAADIIAGLVERTPERRVHTSVQPGVTATGDPRLLRALLQNLLANAWKFTARRPDACIEFTADVSYGRPEPVYVVRDNGAGFDMAHSSKLFGAFQRLHTTREFEGTGVGLATAQRIVHRHGGEIWAKSAPDQGAAFFFTLSPSRNSS